MGLIQERGTVSHLRRTVAEVEAQPRYYGTAASQPCCLNLCALFIGVCSFRWRMLLSPTYNTSIGRWPQLTAQDVSLGGERGVRGQDSC